MRILLYVTNFSPELTGSGKYNGELAEWFAKRGHKVDVITAHPYYPQWQVHRKYQNSWWITERAENLKIWRAPLYVPQKPTGKNRILHEFSFVLSSFPYWLGVLFRRYDVVISVCPPMQVGLLPYLYSCLKKTPFIFHIQDLQVDAARTLGLIKSRGLLSILSKVETFLLRNATIVSSISEGMKSMILNKGVPEYKYFMLPNWVDTSFIRPLLKKDTMRADFGFKVDDIIVLYAGNLGEKQGVDGLLAVAKSLEEHRHIKFLISGEGAVRHLLVKEAERLSLNNVQFSLGVPYNKLPMLLSMADIHVVIQKKGMSDLVLPSKLTTILSVGGGAIVTAEPNSMLAKELIDNQLSEVVPPEDTESLKNAILKLTHPQHLKVLQINARRYAIDNLNQDMILDKFEKFLITLS